MLACVVGMHDDFTFILKAGLSFVPTLQDSTWCFRTWTRLRVVWHPGHSAGCLCFLIISSQSCLPYKIPRGVSGHGHACVWFGIQGTRLAACVSWSSHPNHAYLTRFHMVFQDMDTLACSLASRALGWLLVFLDHLIPSTHHTGLSRGKAIFIHSFIHSLTRGIHWQCTSTVLARSPDGTRPYIKHKNNQYQRLTYTGYNLKIT